MNIFECRCIKHPYIRIEKYVFQFNKVKLAESLMRPLFKRYVLKIVGDIE